MSRPPASRAARRPCPRPPASPFGADDRPGPPPRTSPLILSPACLLLRGDRTGAPQITYNNLPILGPAVEQGSFLPDVQYDLITDYGAHLAVKASLPPRAGGRQDELGKLMLQCRKMCCAPPEKSHVFY